MYAGPGSGKGQLPRKYNRLRDIKGAHRAVPVSPYLGCASPALKSLGDLLHPIGEPLDRQRDARVYLARCRDRIGQPLFRRDDDGVARVFQLVGEQQRGEQQLANLVDAAHAGARLRRFLVDQPTEITKMILLAVTTRDIISATADLDDYLRHTLPPRRTHDRLAGQSIECVDRLLRPASQFFVTAIERLQPMTEIGIARRIVGCGLGASQRPLQPTDCDDETFVCHEILTSTSNARSKRLASALICRARLRASGPYG